MESALTPALTLSPAAARRVAHLAAAEAKPGLMLRITVSGGGCQGFQYAFSFDDQVAAEDHVFERDGARLVTDETSLDLLGGSEIDFVEDLMGAYFQVKNPNATSSCGCGTSFAVA
jgi:iron-sulfur cluster insertion protein